MDAREVARAGESLDRAFDHVEKAVRGMRAAGLDDMADDLETKFLPIHDRALKNHAAMVNAARSNDRSQAKGHYVFLEQCCREMSALGQNAAEEITKLKDAGYFRRGR